MLCTALASLQATTTIVHATWPDAIAVAMRYNGLSNLGPSQFRGGFAEPASKDTHVISAEKPRSRSFVAAFARGLTLIEVFSSSATRATMDGFHKLALTIMRTTVKETGAILP